jgi:hypothetical protein
VAWSFETERFNGNSRGVYQLNRLPSNGTSLLVSINGIPQAQGGDFILQQGNLTASLVFSSAAGQDTGSRVLVTYATGMEYRPAVSWRTLIGEQHTRSWGLGTNSTARLLSNVGVSSNTMTVSDTYNLSMPTADRPGAVWVDDELIEYWTTAPNPQPGFPLATALGSLWRARSGTSASPSDLWSKDLHNGDGVRISWPMPTPLVQPGEAVFVDGRLQTNGIDYTIDSLRNVVFDQPPPVGVNNVMIVICTHQATNQDLVHMAGTTVYDAGGLNQLPSGSYGWYPAPHGMLSLDNEQTRWLLAHAQPR